MMLGQIEEVMKAADRAAAADFKWWFVVLLIIGIVALWQREKAWEKREANLSARLNKVEDERVETLKEANAKNMTVIAENSLAFRTMGQALERAVEHYEKQKKA